MSGSDYGLDDLPLSGADDPQWRGAAGDARDAHPFEFEELERYQGAQLLGVGGMGQVSAVSDQRLNREVALKELADDAEDRAGLERRLAQEAWITAHLEHPGIVPVYDAGRNAQGRLFFTMRLIRGRSLADALAAGDLEQVVLLRHFLAVCQAMAYAHSMGVVHRDLKPANIMIGEFGETQVMDWGLARQMGPEDSGAPTAAPEFVPAAQATQTAVGARVGTPAYMSPEQANAEPVGPTSDVWSLGTVLYEVLTGKPLFEGKSSAEIYAALERGAPLSLDEAASAGPELAAVLECALSHDPAERYSSARTLAADIAAYLDGRRVGAHTYSAWEVMQRFGRTFRLPLMVAAVALVATGVVFGVSYSQTLDERDRARAAELKTQRALTRALAAESQEVVALRQADTNYAARLILKASNAMHQGHQAEAEILAAHALAKGESHLARGVLARFSVGRRPELEFKGNPGNDCGQRAVSPDGRAFLCYSHQTLTLHSGDEWSVRWRTPIDATEYRFVSNDYVLAVDEYGDGPSVLLDAETGARLTELRVEGLEKAVARAGRLLFGNRHRLRLWDSATHRTMRLEGPTGHPRALSGDGRVALATDRAGEFGITDIDAFTTRTVRGHLGKAGRPTTVDLNRDGSLLATGGADGVLRVVSTENGAVVWERSTGRRAVEAVSWSPDDTWLLTMDAKDCPTIFDGGGNGRLGFPTINIDRFSWRQRDGAVDLITTGKDFSAYRMPEAFFPTLVNVSSPLEALALSRDGTALALAHGKRFISVFGRDGARRRQHALSEGGMGLGVAFVEGSNRDVAVTNGIAPKLSVYRSEGAEDRSGVILSGKLFPVVHGGIVAVQTGGSVSLHPKSGKTHRVKAKGARFNSDAASSADGTRVAVLDISGTVAWFEVGPDRLSEPKLLPTRTKGLSIALNGDGSVMAIGKGYAVLLFDIETGRRTHRFDGPSSVISTVALARDGSWVAAGTGIGEVFVWDPSGRLRMLGESQREQIVTLAFGPDQQTLFSASEEGSVVAWGLAALKPTAAALVQQHEAAWGLGLPEAMAVDVR